MYYPISQKILTWKSDLDAPPPRVVSVFVIGFMQINLYTAKIVVKLFNAIEHGHKATFNSGVKRPGFSLEKDLAIKKTKKAFVDYLVASAGTQQVEGKPAIASSVNAKKPVESQKNIPTTAQSTGKWNVIKDDFMLNESSLKNWDVDE